MPKNPASSYKKEWVLEFSFFLVNQTKTIEKRDYPHFKYQRISYLDLKKHC